MSLINPTAKIGGRYKIEAFTQGNPPRLLADWFDNLITDYGMNQAWDGANGRIEYCSVGTGNTPPSYADTMLVAEKTKTRSYSTHLNGSTSQYIYWRRTFQFNAGEAAGNLSEVGVGGYNAGTLFSRALIKDAQGDPTTITVLPSEILQVTWELRLAKPETVSGTVDIEGSGTHSYTIETQNGSISNSYQPYIEISAFPDDWISASNASSMASVSSATKQAYVQNSFQITTRVTASIASANFSSGIGGLIFKPFRIAESYYKLKATFDPPIMKTSDKSLALDVLVSWARD